MKQLTKKQRHQIYKKAIRLIKKEQFACHAIGMAYNNTYNCDESVFTEIMLFKDFSRPAWLDGDPLDDTMHVAGSDKGNEFRELVLLFCMEMTR